KVGSRRDLAGAGASAHGRNDRLVESSLRTNDVFQRPRQRSCLEEHEWQAVSTPALAVQSKRIVFVGACARQRRTADGGDQDVYGALLELLRQRRVLHRQYED